MSLRLRAALRDISFVFFGLPVPFDVILDIILILAVFAVLWCPPIVLSSGSCGHFFGFSLFVSLRASICRNFDIFVAVIPPPSLRPTNRLRYDVELLPYFALLPPRHRQFPVSLDILCLLPVSFRCRCEPLRAPSNRETPARSAERLLLLSVSAARLVADVRPPSRSSRCQPLSQHAFETVVPATRKASCCRYQSFIGTLGPWTCPLLFPAPYVVSLPSGAWPGHPPSVAGTRS